MKSNRRNFIQSGLLGGSTILTLNLNADQHSHHNSVGGLKKVQSKFDPTKDPKRVRKSFYDLTDEELRTLCKAVGYMRNDMPTDSPLHWENYGRQHAHHCTEAGDNNPQVHWSWHFLPWHRGYVYFLERILANILTTKLNIDGSKFAYPYWDWMTHKEIPNTRLREQAGLASPLFGYDLTQENMVNADNLGFDNTALYDGNRGPTRIGKNRTMGTLRYAALDPIFYMHHGNIDRIFSMYSQPMPDLDGPWGQQTYQYTDIDGSWITVSVKDIMTGITNNISYDKKLTVTKPMNVNRNIVVRVGKQISNEPIEVKLEGSIYKAIVNSSIALMDVTTGPITFTGKYQIDIYLTDGSGVKTNVGRIRMLDGEHRKDNKDPKTKHTFSVLLKPFKVSQNGSLTLTFVPPKNGVPIDIKTLEFMSME